MTHFRIRTVINDQIITEQCIPGGLTDVESNIVLASAHEWKSTVDLSEIERWLVTALMQGAPADGPGSAVKVADGLDNFKVTFCDGGPYCTLQG